MSRMCDEIRFVVQSGGEFVDVEGRSRRARGRALLDPLEAGEPVRLEGLSLRRWVDQHRGQRFEWFEVRPDDTVVPSGVAGS